MACGLKKQNNNEGGVHLTERTCSPYNPIIKLIVDDCLGLPIYPVTSVDAVIDEEGKTLRSLLEDIFIKIKDGNVDISGNILEILDRIAQLEEEPVLKNDFENLKNLVYAISSLTAESDTDKLLHENGYPKIVNTINELKKLYNLSDIINRLNALELTKEILKSLIVAIANFDTNSHISDFQNLGLVVNPSENPNGIIEIIYLMSNILNRLTAVESLIRIPPDNTAILQRLNNLESDILKCAHLDERVLAQATDDESRGLENWQTLKAGELPPNVIDVWTTGYLRSFQGGAPTMHNKLIYLGLLLREQFDIDPSLNILDIYPLFHTDDSKGSPLLYRKQDGSFIPLLDALGNILRMGDGKFSIEEVSTIISIILNDITIPTLSEEITNDAKNSPDGKPGVKLSLIYVVNNANNERCLVGNVNGDDVVNIGDINAVLNTLMSYYKRNTPSVTLNTPSALQKDKGTILYYDSNGLRAMYPCIPRLIYIDRLTGDSYTYVDKQLRKVSYTSYSGDSNIAVSELLDYSSIDDDDNLIPAKRTINVTSKFPKYEAGEEIYFLSDEDLNTVHINSAVTYLAGENITIETQPSEEDKNIEVRTINAVFPRLKGNNGVQILPNSLQSVLEPTYTISLDKSSFQGIESVSELPQTASSSAIYFNTTDSLFYVHNLNTSEWVTLNNPTTVLVTSINGIEVTRKTKVYQGKPAVHVGAATYDLLPGHFYDISNWLALDFGEEITDYELVFNVNGTSVLPTEGRFMAWKDNANIRFDGEVGMPYKEAETFSLLQYHLYEFKCYRRVLTIRDITSTDPQEDSPDVEQSM